MIPELTSFVVELQSLTLDEVSDLPFFKDCDTIANIDDLEFIRHGPFKEINLKPKTQSKPLKQTQKKSKPNTPNLQKRFAPLNRAIQSERKHYTPNRALVRNIRTGLAQRQSSSASKTVHFDSKQHKSLSLKPLRVNLSNAKKVKPSIKDLQLLSDNLCDLVPPDVDVFDIEIDKIFLKNPDEDGSEYDSVSCASSSDCSYKTCVEEQDEVSSNKSLMPFDESNRPGLKLDYSLLGPISREELESLPAVPIYRCDKPRCDFTTNIATVMNHHDCIKARLF